MPTNQLLPSGKVTRREVVKGTMAFGGALALGAVASKLNIRRSEEERAKISKALYARFDEVPIGDTGTHMTVVVGEHGYNIPADTKTLNELRQGRFANVIIDSYGFTPLVWFTSTYGLVSVRSFIDEDQPHGLFQSIVDSLHPNTKIIFADQSPVDFGDGPSGILTNQMHQMHQVTAELMVSTAGVKFAIDHLVEPILRKRGIIKGSDKDRTIGEKAARELVNLYLLGPAAARLLFITGRLSRKAWNEYREIEADLYSIFDKGLGDIILKARDNLAALKIQYLAKNSFLADGDDGTSKTLNVWGASHLPEYTVTKDPDELLDWFTPAKVKWLLHYYDPHYFASVLICHPTGRFDDRGRILYEVSRIEVPELEGLVTQALADNQ